MYDVSHGMSIPHLGKADQYAEEVNRNVFLRHLVLTSRPRIRMSYSRCTFVQAWELKIHECRMFELQHFDSLAW